MQHCPLCTSKVPDTAQICPICGASLGDASSGDAAAADERAGALVPGTHLADRSYSVGKILGRGGFGITYLGADLRLGRPIALKEFFPAGAMRRGTDVVPPPTLARADYLAATRRFLQEAQVLARFRHPSIVAVYDVFEGNATAYMVMEYLGGETLASRLEQHGRPFAESELTALAAQLAEALDVIHAEGVLHRDIKPENVILANGAGASRPILIDFGSAREFARGRAMRQSVVITPGYAPLEQYAEQARRGPFTDVYALAATLYHLATGIPPPAATDRATGVLLKPPRALNPALSEAFDRALTHALEMPVDRRPQTAGAFAQELAGRRATHATGRRTTGKPPGGRRRDTAPVAPVSPHLTRAQQLVRELAAGAAIQRKQFTCPVCRGATLVDPVRQPKGEVPCPVCRAAPLRVRFAVAERRRCPACRSGKLRPVPPRGLMRCPACRLGFVMEYVKRRTLLIVPDIWAACDTCGADFDRHLHGDTLRLVALPNGPGLLDPRLQGRTLARVAWMRLAERTHRELRCRDCSAEFDVHLDGTLAWIAAAGRLELVPPEHRGQRRSPLEWAKIAHGLQPEDGTHACPSCHAQFDETEPRHLTLLRAARDPYGIVATYGAWTLPVVAWRRLAAGKRDPTSPGLICPACSAELRPGRGRGHPHALVAFDNAHDPHGTGARYQGQQLARSDWQRLAAGRLPLAEERRLRAEAEGELWAAALAGELSDPEAERSYPGRKSGGEKVVLALPAGQIQQTEANRPSHDRGRMWITTKRLLYQGKQASITVPLASISDCGVQRLGRTHVLAIRRCDQDQPLYFRAAARTLDVAVDGTPVRLRIDVSSLAALVKALP